MDITRNAVNSIDDIFQQLNEKADLVYKHLWLYNEHDTHSRDYGTGQLITTAEVHTIGIIESNEGISVTKLALICHRTKGTVSQLVNKLEKNGYISRVKLPDNGKTVRLYITENGKIISRAHKAYDRSEVTRIINELLKECTMDEINSFYKVLACRNNILESDHKNGVL